MFSFFCSLSREDNETLLSLNISIDTFLGSGILEEERRIKETLQRHLSRLTVITIFISQQPAIEMSKREILTQKEWKTLEAPCQTIFHKRFST